MLVPLVKFPLVLVLLILFAQGSISQSLIPDSSASPGYKNAIAFYNGSLAEELHLYNGIEDKGYPYQFAEGTPYFITNNWSEGTLKYEGKWYENVPLLYDAAADEVVYLYFNKISRIKLIKEKVSEFSIQDHHFIQISSNSPAAKSIAPGFYDQLYAGKISLLAKRAKSIQKTMRQSGEEVRVFDKDHYYLKKGYEIYPVSNKRSFLRNLSDKRKELLQYIRQNKLSFRKDMEKSMSQTIAYYNQLISA